jgi:hypothetical protein
MIERTIKKGTNSLFYISYQAPCLNLHKTTEQKKKLAGISFFFLLSTFIRFFLSVYHIQHDYCARDIHIKIRVYFFLFRDVAGKDDVWVGAITQHSRTHKK